MDFPILTKRQWIIVALGLPVFFALAGYGFILLLAPLHLTPIQLAQFVIILFLAGATLGTFPIWLPRALPLKVITDIFGEPEDEEDEDE